MIHTLCGYYSNNLAKKYYEVYKTEVINDIHFQVSRLYWSNIINLIQTNIDNTISEQTINSSKLGNKKKLYND